MNYEQPLTPLPNTTSLTKTTAHFPTLRHSPSIHHAQHSTLPKLQLPKLTKIHQQYNKQITETAEEIPRADEDLDLQSARDERKHEGPDVSEESPWMGIK